MYGIYSAVQNTVANIMQNIVFVLSMNKSDAIVIPIIAIIFTSCLQLLAWRFIPPLGCRFS